jgi:hypothetical protein
MHAIGGDASRDPLLDTISSPWTKPSDGNSEADVAAGGAPQDVMSAFMLAIMLRACKLYSSAVVFVRCTLYLFVCHLHVNCLIVFISIQQPNPHPRIPNL